MKSHRGNGMIIGRGTYIFLERVYQADFLAWEATEKVSPSSGAATLIAAAGGGQIIEHWS
jgi:hypothetical protein